MNDFTIDELDDILLCVDALRICSIRGEARYGNLYKKLQDMIVNYCDHEFIFTLYDSKVHCHKCKKTLRD